MKKIAVIGLLVLLLYNMFGLATAVLLFDQQYKVSSVHTLSDHPDLLKMYLPSLPYASDWENEEGIEGLIKTNGQFYNATHVKHENDTLYVTITSNEAARDHFFELANKMQALTDLSTQMPENSRDKAMKVLDHFLKNYIQNIYRFQIDQQKTAIETNVAIYPSEQTKHVFCITQLQTPPPENVSHS